MVHYLGRRPAPDERDAGFLMRSAQPPIEVPLPAYRYWSAGPVLDQGLEQTERDRNSCVGYAWKQWLTTSPVRHAADALAARDIYHEAQLVDEWPGEDYNGTSVRAGAKVMQAHGRLTSYVWAQTASDVTLWLLTQGPVVLGTNWYETMFQPDEGIVHVGGEVVGGHAYLAIGYNMRAGMVRCLNSWGSGWGEHGRFWIALADLTRLLEESGEACTALEVM